MSGLDYISSPKNNYLYQQKEFFEDYGFDLHYFNARMFDSQLGRFHSNDPLIIFASPYNGMGNNPVSLVDPTGMAPGWPPGGNNRRNRNYRNVIYGDNNNGKSNDKQSWEWTGDDWPGIDNVGGNRGGSQYLNPNSSNGLSHGSGGNGGGGSNSDNSGYTDNPERPEPNKAQLVQQAIDVISMIIKKEIDAGINLPNVDFKFNNQLTITELFFLGAKESFDKQEWTVPGNKKIEKLRFFAEMVKSNAPFDIKRQGKGFHPSDLRSRKAIFEGEVYDYDDFGNINYGYAAKIFGLSEEEAVYAAGLYQTLGQLSPDFTNPKGLFDNTKDTKYIIFGFNFVPIWGR